MAKIIQSYPELYAKASNGKIKYWRIEVVEDKNDIFIVKHHGYAPGILTRDTKQIVSGKNIGKSNETTISEQAIFEAQSDWYGKIDKKYTESPTVDDVDNIILPMLAHRYDQRSHNIIWPACVQPKLDGIRCLITMNKNKIVYQSRSGKIFTTMGHLDEGVTQLLNTLPKKSYLDGELYIHGETFQGITKLIKKYRPDETEKIEYHMYDIITSKENDTFENRFASQFSTLNTLVQDYKIIKIVPTINVADELEMKQQHNIFVSDGYEGTIIRNLNGLYLKDHRSVDLQKYKDFLEDDYLVTNVFEAEGGDIGTAIFECITPQEKTFRVRPKGTREKRTEWYNKRDQYINKYLSVRYQELSEDLVPRFPVGLGFKEDR